MRKLMFPFYFFTLCITMSCEQNINLELQAYEPKAVVYSLLKTGQTPEVIISKSETFYGWIEKYLRERVS